MCPAFMNRTEKFSQRRKKEIEIEARKAWMIVKNGRSLHLFSSNQVIVLMSNRENKLLSAAMNVCKLVSEGYDDQNIRKGYKLLKFLVTLNLFIGGGNRI